jgi:hypothetical protein
MNSRDIAVDGTIGTHISVPPLLSGSLQSAYSIISDASRNSRLSLRDIEVISNSLVGETRFRLGELSLLQYAGISYMLF